MGLGPPGDSWLGTAGRSQCRRVFCWTATVGITGTAEIVGSERRRSAIAHLWHAGFAVARTLVSAPDLSRAGGGPSARDRVPCVTGCGKIAGHDRNLQARVLASALGPQLAGSLASAYALHFCNAEAADPVVSAALGRPSADALRSASC